MTQTRQILFAALAGIVIAAPVRAQQAPPAIDVAASIAGSSDYVWRGLTQTGGQPAAFATVTVSAGGFYAGVGTENVDFGGISQEYDLWGGYVFDLGADTKLDLGLSFYGYVDAPQTIDTLEVKAALTRSDGRFNYGLSGYYTGNYFGTAAPAFYGEFAAGYQITDRLAASAAVGIQSIEALPDYATWNLGGSYDLGHGIKLDARYHDSEKAKVGNVGGARLVGTLTFGF